MFTSKLFWIASLVAGLAAAATIWNGDNHLATAGYSLVGAPVIGWFVWFMWGKIAPKLDM